ncbi:hypothetical protein Tco_0722208 [Tanacetum coccineum]
MTEILFGKPFKENVGLEEDINKGVLWFKIRDDKTIFNMPRAKRKLGSNSKEMESRGYEFAQDMLVKSSSLAIIIRKGGDFKEDNVGDTVKEVEQVMEDSDSDEVEDVYDETANFMASGDANDASLLEDEDYHIYDTYDLDGLTKEQQAIYEAYDINLRRKPRR